MRTTSALRSERRQPRDYPINPRAAPAHLRP